MDPEETPKERLWRRMRKCLRCIICPPHRGENRDRRHGRHGRTKARYKDRRKGTQ